MRFHINRNIARHYTDLYSSICQGILILTSVRVKRHHRYKFIPVCYTDIKLIYLDEFEDLEREIYAGSAYIQISGWEFMDEFNPKNFVKRIHEIEFDKSNRGYWIFLDGKSDTTSTNYITLSDFQFWRRHDVALALRYYTHEAAKVIITFESSNGSHHSTVLNSVGKTRKKNFAHLCTVFILPPIEGSVEKGQALIIHPLPQTIIPAHEITISGVTSLNSFVVIDKILLAVGDDNRGLHMLYTLQPQSWCKNALNGKICYRCDFDLIGIARNRIVNCEFITLNVYIYVQLGRVCCQSDK
ncbi:unnamed protein product [Allacma fusca]|uniref:Uncharacterized protein n=1 Tax=Allacma fusca TaxID=39272 RepID=A0A8J2NXQ8_9HEXA|nr:unnamed protein product [Allacma fusca]